MAEFLSLWHGACRSSVMEDLAEAQHYADENRDRELAAVTRVQATFRGAQSRAWIERLRVAACEVERVFRGFVGRDRWRKAVADRRADEQLAFFHYESNLLQKTFRGYYSRKYFHDFHARKAYIQSVMANSQALKGTLEEHSKTQQLEEEKRQAAAARVEFETITKNLHHLVSTKSQPGIYNSPYYQDSIPTAYNQPIETHLEQQSRRHARRRISPGKVRARGGGTRGSSGGGQMGGQGQGQSMHPGGLPGGGRDLAPEDDFPPPPPHGMPGMGDGDTARGNTASTMGMGRSAASRGGVGTVGSMGSGGLGGTGSRVGTAHSMLSVQASSAYGMVEDARKQEERYSRLQQLDQRAWTAGGRPPHNRVTGGINTNLPFVEAWRSSQNSRDCEDKTQRITSAPFYTAATKKGGQTFDAYAFANAMAASPGGDRGGAGATWSGGGVSGPAGGSPGRPEVA